MEVECVENSNIYGISSLEIIHLCEHKCTHSVCACNECEKVLKTLLENFCYALNIMQKKKRIFTFVNGNFGVF